MTPEQKDRQYIEGRLPNRQWIRTPEIAAAFNRSIHTIIAYIESGRIADVRNYGAGRKRYFECEREAVIRCWISLRFNG